MICIIKKFQMIKSFVLTINLWTIPDTDDHGDTVVGDMAEDMVGEAGEEDMADGAAEAIGVEEEVGEVAGDIGVNFVPRIKWYVYDILSPSIYFLIFCINIRLL